MLVRIKNIPRMRVLKYKDIGIQGKIKIFCVHCGSILEILSTKIFFKKGLKNSRKEMDIEDNN